MNFVFKNIVKPFGEIVRPLILALALFYGAAVVSAWTGPTSAPPGNNAPAPINVSGTSQVKAGGLWIGSLGTDGGATFGGNVGVGTVSPGQKLDVAGYIRGTGLCIGSDCRTAWPPASYNDLPRGSVAGYCEGGLHQRAPAGTGYYNPDGNSCGCEAGWEVFKMGSYTTGDFEAGVNLHEVYSCIKN